MDTYRELKVTLLTQEQRKFTLEELKQYDGKNGKPAYIAYQGKVYEIPQNGLWSDGEHMGLHEAGKDLTEEMELAPHREEVLQKAKLIGVLA
jgi:predicted heme/steroid binding protein